MPTLCRNRKGWATLNCASFSGWATRPRCRLRREAASARQHFLCSKTEMKQITRDNLIYLGVALSVVGLIVADFIYADSRGQKMWWPSRFAFRAGYTTVLLAYFVARETRKLKETVVQMLLYIFLAGLVHLAIMFTFRRAALELSGITFAALAVFEIFSVFQLLMLLVRYLRSGDRSL